MKLNSKKIIIIVIIIIVLVIASLIFVRVKKKDNQNNVLIVEDEYIQIDRNQLSYQDSVTVDELKNSVGLTGNSDIYEIIEEFDGRKTLVVKSDIKYKVAFAGMIKNSIPKMDELENILATNKPTENGIWVEKNSRNKLLEMLNGEKLNSKYSIDENGYLRIEEKNNKNDLDKKLEKSINGKKQYILDISSSYYIIDNVTGEILDYNFEDIDKYQIYETVQYEEKTILFISQNTKGIYSDDEIIDSIVNFLY